jgi:hypothetical protein
MSPGSAGHEMKFFQVNLQKFDKRVLCFLNVSEDSLSISSIEKCTFLGPEYMGTGPEHLARGFRT